MHKLLAREIERFRAEAEFDSGHLIELVAAAYQEMDRERQQAVVANTRIAEENAQLTARLRAGLEDLQLSNRRFEAAIDNMAHGLTMLDKGQRLIVGNRRFEEIYSLPPNVMVPGTPLADLIRYSIEKGIFADAGILDVMQVTLDQMKPDEVAQRLFKLSTGRIIACTVTLLADDGCVLLHEDVTEKRRAERQLAESEQRFRDFVAAASDWCWETDAEHRFSFFTAALQAHTGINPEKLIGRKSTEFAPHTENSEVAAAFVADIQALRPFSDVVIRFRNSKGRLISIKSSGSPRFDRQGKFLGYRGTGKDVTAEEERKLALERAQSQLEDRAARLNEAQSMGRLGDWSYRIGDAELWWSPQVYGLLGYDPETFQPALETVVALYLGNGFERLRASQLKLVDGDSVATVDVQARRADGSICDLAITSKAMIGNGGEIIGRYGTIQDITDRKEAERRLEQLAYYDPLTGLANRALFKRKLTELIGRCSERNGSGALLLIDLDRFKEVNDSLGHAAGDELLLKVGVLLRQFFGESAFVARLGGDEFAVLIENAADGLSPGLVAGDLIRQLSRSVELAAGEAFIGATIGIACVPQDGATGDEALRNADLALYRAKEAGRGRSMSFEPAYARAVEERHELGRHLRHAIDAGDLTLHYQAQVELETGRVSGFEALARWNHRERGPISPAVFIPIAESSGLIANLGTWALHDACRQAKSWLDAGLPTRTVSVNVSVAQFWNMDFETVVAAILAETGLPADMLCLELTENLFVDHAEHRASATLKALADLGVRLALDDFGTGYSSLGYLTRLPFQCLKIDRSFVAGIAGDADKRRLLKGIIALARGLRMSVVAEGAETKAEVKILTELGCGYVQGYVFARPAAAEEALALASRLEARSNPAPSLVPGSDEPLLQKAKAIDSSQPLMSQYRTSAEG